MMNYLDNENKKEQYFSVSELNSQAKQLLEVQMNNVFLVGEISSWVESSIKHWYITLKDKQANVHCVMFKTKNKLIPFKPEIGIQILVRGTVSLYQPKGNFQFIIDYMREFGEGNLQKKFEILKHKLQTEGLFDQIHKKKLPMIPLNIGIITSLESAALQDILSVTTRRFPLAKLTIIPTSVQGKQALNELLNAIKLTAASEFQLIIITRGGGSLEDLWVFNEEKLARAIYLINIPVISAIGHETDFTIIDFVADIRAPTPSAAAEISTLDQNELISQLNTNEQQLTQKMKSLILIKEQYVDNLSLKLQKTLKNTDFYINKVNNLIQSFNYFFIKKLQTLEYKVNLNTQRLYQSIQFNKLNYLLSPLIDTLSKIIRLKFLQYESLLKELTNRLANSTLIVIKKSNDDLKRTALNLNSLSPLAIISRGYAVIKKENKLVRSIKQVNHDDTINILLIDGQLIVKVCKINLNNREDKKKKF